MAGCTYQVADGSTCAELSSAAAVVAAAGGAAGGSWLRTTPASARERQRRTAERAMSEVNVIQLEIKRQKRIGLSMQIDDKGRLFQSQLQHGSVAVKARGAKAR